MQLTEIHNSCVVTTMQPALCNISIETSPRKHRKSIHKCLAHSYPVLTIRIDLRVTMNIGVDHSTQSPLSYCHEKLIHSS